METKKLGFGLMRLPTLENGEIDIEQVGQMTDAFLENGFTYFDTSFVYHNGKSEDALKQAVVMRHPRESFTIATKFPTFAVQTEDQVEPIFAQQLQNLGTDYVDYYLLHILNTKLYNGMDGKGGVVKTCHLFDHVREWKRQGKVRHMGFSCHDSAQLLDQILTENPDVEFVQIVINYFDWESSFIQSRACYEVIRRHGKKVVVMEPVKGGCLAALPEDSEKKLKAMDPNASPASWALRFAASREGLLTVLSGMSNMAQMQDNIGTMKDFQPLTKEEQDILVKLADSQKASGPIGMADFSAYEGVTYHDIPAAALLDSYNAAMVQPNPNFSVELNYLANELLKLGVTDTAYPFPEETVVVNGEDVTAKVKEAWDFLIARCSI
ncbi:MAG: aldo/keto reductase [Oscillospiraceae bacterium]|nr:aldo/keto reductase [Oscillospiraceae bacterium]